MIKKTFIYIAGCFVLYACGMQVVSPLKLDLFVPDLFLSCTPVLLEGVCGPDGNSNILITSQDNADFFETGPFSCSCTDGEIEDCFDGNNAPIDRINMCGLGPSGNFPVISATIVDQFGDQLADVDPVELINPPSSDLDLPTSVTDCTPITFVGTTPPSASCYPDGVDNVTIGSRNGNDDFANAPYTCSCDQGGLANCTNALSMPVTTIAFCGTGSNGLEPKVTMTVVDQYNNSASDEPYVLVTVTP